VPYLIQRLLALVGLVVLGPLILALGLAVRLTSPGPAFHRAVRVRPGGMFTLYKLRSMRADAASTGPGVTASGDRRVTHLGRLLRRTKLDELPQLWNVVRGVMALVGPRPEDPRYVDLTDPLHARVFGALPGITGPTALAFRDEEILLERAARDRAKSAGRDEPTVGDIDAAYRLDILPVKLASDSDYLDSRSARGDIRIILATLGLGSLPPNDGAQPARRGG
jgi:lipopolysaccharide/colanic/teichoic acid biosynthesis glycosyltransferase